MKKIVGYLSVIIMAISIAMSSLFVFAIIMITLFSDEKPDDVAFTLAVFSLPSLIFTWAVWTDFRFVNYIRKEWLNLPPIEYEKRTGKNTQAV